MVALYPTMPDSSTSEHSLHSIKTALTRTALDTSTRHSFQNRIPPFFWQYLAAALKTQILSNDPTGASAYLIIKLVHGHGGHGVAVGLSPIPMAVLGVNPVAGFRAELQAVLAVAVLTGVHHLHWPRPGGDPHLVRGRRGWRGLALHSPFWE